LAATNNLLRVTPRQGKNLVFVATLVPYSSRSALKMDRAQLEFEYKNITERRIIMSETGRIGKCNQPSHSEVMLELPEEKKRYGVLRSVSSGAHKIVQLVRVFIVSIAAVVSAIFARITSERQNQFSWMSTSLRRTVNRVHATVVDFLSAGILGIFVPINLEKLDPKKYNPAGGTPILLLHGFLGTSSNWIYHRYRLKNAGHKNVFTINLGHPFTSIENYAECVKEKVSKIQEITRRKDLIIIAHSMGGNVAREYRYEYAEAQGAIVKKIITLGTPLEGTRIANLAPGLSRAAKEMRHQSSFVMDHKEHAKKDKKTRYFHISTRVDHIILPPSSARKGGGKRRRCVTLRATGHVGYLFSSKVAGLILQEVQPRELPV